MNAKSLTEIPSFATASKPKQTAAARYHPTTLTPERWEQVRVEVLDLVARCKPTFTKEVALLGGNLCARLAIHAGEVHEFSVAALLTRQNLDRIIVGYQLENMNPGTLGQVQD